MHHFTAQRCSNHFKIIQISLLLLT